MTSQHPDIPTDDRPVQRPINAEYNRGAMNAAAVEPSLRDRVRWGPIVAGVFTALTTLVVMTVLGLALGMSAFEPDDAGGRTIGTAAAIWGIISVVLAFFLGGWIAGRNALGSAEDNGAVNGFLVGAVTIAVMLLMIGAGLGNLMGVAGANIDEISQVTSDMVGQTDGEEAVAIAQENYDSARDIAWGTLAGLVVALAAATAGGALGHPDRTMVVPRAPTRRAATQPR